MAGGAVKELTPEYVLGRHLILGADRWRVLEIHPEGDVRVLLSTDASKRGRWPWRTVQGLIQDGTITVD